MSPASGFPQDALLHIDGFDKSKDPRVDVLEAQLAELKAMIAEQNKPAEGGE